LIFTSFIMIWSLFNRDRMPEPEAPSDLLDDLRASACRLSVVGLILLVIGSIYVGVATPTEASAFGVAGAILLSAFTGTMSWSVLMSRMREAVRTTCMIGFILIGASVFT